MNDEASLFIFHLLRWNNAGVLTEQTPWVWVGGEVGIGTQFYPGRQGLSAGERSSLAPSRCATDNSEWHSLACREPKLQNFDFDNEKRKTKHNCATWHRPVLHNPI